jgi:hypothetical protein
MQIVTTEPEAQLEAELGLNGRSISSRGKEVQKCNEFGTVVVQITVNRNGMLLLPNIPREPQIQTHALWNQHWHSRNINGS